MDVVEGRQKVFGDHWDVQPETEELHGLSQQRYMPVRENLQSSLMCLPRLEVSLSSVVVEASSSCGMLDQNHQV